MRSSCTSSTRGWSGARSVEPARLEKARAKIATAAAGIRARDYTPRPSADGVHVLPVPRHLPVERGVVTVATGTVAVAAITIDFGNTLVRVDRPGLRDVVEVTGDALVEARRRARAGRVPRRLGRGARAAVPRGRAAAPRGRHRPARGSRPRSAAWHGRRRRPTCAGTTSPRRTRVAPEEVDAVVEAYSAAFVDRMEPVADATDDAPAPRRARVRPRDPLELAPRADDRPLRRGAGLAAAPARDRRVPAGRHDQAPSRDLPRRRGVARTRRGRRARRSSTSATTGRRTWWVRTGPAGGRRTCAIGRTTRRCQRPSQATTCSLTRAVERRPRRSTSWPSSTRWSTSYRVAHRRLRRRRPPRLPPDGRAPPEDRRLTLFGLALLGWVAVAIVALLVDPLASPGAGFLGAAALGFATGLTVAPLLLARRLRAPSADRLSRRLAEGHPPRRLGRRARRRVRRDAPERHLPAADRAVPGRPRARRRGHADRRGAPVGTEPGSARMRPGAPLDGGFRTGGVERDRPPAPLSRPGPKDRRDQAPSAHAAQWHHARRARAPPLPRHRPPTQQRPCPSPELQGIGLRGRLRRHVGLGRASSTSTTTSTCRPTSARRRSPTCPGSPIRPSSSRATVDVAIVGAPFDDMVTHRPGAQIRPAGDPRGAEQLGRA